MSQIIFKVLMIKHFCMFGCAHYFALFTSCIKHWVSVCPVYVHKYMFILLMVNILLTVHCAMFIGQPHTHTSYLSSTGFPECHWDGSCFEPIYLLCGTPIAYSLCSPLFRHRTLCSTNRFHPAYYIQTVQGTLSNQSSERHNWRVFAVNMPVRYFSLPQKNCLAGDHV